MAAETSSIKIYNTTKVKIEKMKGNQSLPVFVESMIYYFEITGLSPKSMRAHPSEELKEGIERVIKIIRNIEKTKVDNMIDMMRKLVSEKAIGNRGDGVFAKEDIEAMLAYKDGLEIALNTEKNKNKKYIKKVENALKTLNEVIIEDEKTNELLALAIKILKN